jgi:energy-coupling factor transport system ATP-binding protein
MSQHNNRQEDNTTTTAVAVSALNFHYTMPEDHQKSEQTAWTTTRQEQTNILEDITFSLASGELLLIAGPSGCGKSTLLKCLNGLIPHSYKGVMSGNIHLQGRSTHGMNLRDLASYVGTMLQDPDKQIVASTVEQEIAFGLENLGTPRAEMRQRIQAVLHQLHLKQAQKRSTIALSGGQRQQIAAAGILIMRPKILLFDEPFANLDAQAISVQRQHSWILPIHPRSNSRSKVPYANSHLAHQQYPS